MRKILTALTVIMLITAAVFTGCSESDGQKGDKIEVVVTAFPHYEFVKAVGGDKVNVTMLIKPGNEVHTYEPSAKDIAKISDCDIFIYTGGESDLWADKILSSTKKEDTAVISFLEASGVCEAHGHSHDKEHSHTSHDVSDEHVWTSPKKAISIVEKITKVLCEKDSENKDFYTKNSEEYLQELSELDSELSGVVLEAKREKIIVGDRFPFYHLAKDYGIKYSAAFSGCSSETEPGAKVVAELGVKVKEENIPVVFKIEFSNGKIASSIAEGSDAQILTLHSCHTISQDDFDKGVGYISLMKQNIENLRKALS